MKYTIAAALTILRPDSSWNLDGSEYSGLEWLDSGTAPTEEEINTELTRLNNAEPMRLLRVERDKRLTDCDWVVTKAFETGSSVPESWKTYRQALRDITLSTQSIFSVTWPTEPS